MTGSSTAVAILAGGSGTRLWPLSRSRKPKHLLDFTGEGTLLRLTYDRVRTLGDPVLVVCPPEHAALVRHELPEVAAEHVIVEPAPRGTAPALALAALSAASLRPGATLVTVPADHFAADPVSWRQDLERAAVAASATGGMATVGIVPAYPSTGYGYIECGAEVGPAGAREMVRFREKPDRATAEAFLAQGNFYWNASYFTFAPGALEREMEQHAPQYLAAARLALGGDQSAYLALQPETIDYAVMERTRALVVIPSDQSFGDIGSWADLHEVMSRDGAGNAVNGRALVVDSQDSVIISQDRLVAALGLRDIVIVDTADAVLICPRERAQDVKKLVEQLRHAGEEGLL
jgi:mannose-1-phosphate guanylyltransferase/mannose-6-phosphate isomerase